MGTLFLGGLVTAVLFCRYQKFPLFRFLDLVVPSLVLGQAIGRWGNFAVTRQIFPAPVPAFLESGGGISTLPIEK